eukprot:3985807-Amphidinium_carterae.2
MVSGGGSGVGGGGGDDDAGGHDPLLVVVLNAKTGCKEMGHKANTSKSQGATRVSPYVLAVEKCRFEHLVSTSSLAGCARIGGGV